jgi:hypothetical protein
MKGLVEKYKEQLLKKGGQPQVDPTTKLVLAINKYSIKIDELFSKYCDEKHHFLDLTRYGLMMRFKKGIYMLQ